MNDDSSHPCIWTAQTHVTAAAARMRMMRERLRVAGYYALDVPPDGSCFIWSVLRPMTSYLGRQTTEHELRQLIVDAIAAAPHLKSDLSVDLKNTNAMRQRAFLRPLTSIDELLDDFRRPKRFLPPIIAIRALEWMTNASVLLLSAYPPDYDVMVMHESDAGAPYFLRLFYDTAGEHVVPLLALPQPARQTPLPSPSTSFRYT